MMFTLLVMRYENFVDNQMIKPIYITCDVACDT